MSILLTKSRFLTALECPTKLYYNINNYPSELSNNEFLIALADGGMQVGALAKCYYPEGELVSEINIDEAVENTLKLLEKENVVLFEAAFKFNNSFVRADILEKKANIIKIIEVKSKSYRERKDLFKKDGIPNNKWENIFQDLAFQHYVVTKSLAEKYKVESNLCLVDKSKKATVNSLNQIFKINKTSNGISLIEYDKNAEVGERILSLVDVSDSIQKIVNEEVENVVEFSEKISKFEKLINEGRKLQNELSKKCKTCEYDVANEKSGFNECWDTILNKGTKNNIIYNIVRYSKNETDEKFNTGIYFITELDQDEFGKIPKENSKIALDSKTRQALQVRSVKNQSSQDYLNCNKLKEYFAKWKHPYHLIDFETTRVAIPYFKNYRPYQNVAFQFSHHEISSDWNIKHAGEFLEIDSSTPNINFIRELQKQLGRDTGSVFIYSGHEKTVLKELKDELSSEYCEERDKDSLIEFINTLTDEKSERYMVDLLEVLNKTYYDPMMGGSSSLKKVLHAILNSSKFLQEKYSQPVYGTDFNRSINFRNKTWVQYENGKVTDPYKIIHKPDEYVSEEEADRIFELTDISNGSSAMLAYSRLQSTEVEPNVREEIENALLQYCELDTLAMVMLLEFWKNRIL